MKSTPGSIAETELPHGRRSDYERNVSPEQRYFINVLAAVIRGEDVPSVPEPFDGERFYELCRRHNLSGMIRAGLLKTSIAAAPVIQDLFDRDAQTYLFYRPVSP